MLGKGGGRAKHHKERRGERTIYLTVPPNGYIPKYIPLNFD